MHRRMCNMEEEGWLHTFYRLNLIIHLENVKEDTVLFFRFQYKNKVKLR